MLIRPATIEDAKRLFEWRNDPVTCAMSRNTAPVNWFGHVDWLRQRLAWRAPMLFIAEVDGMPVGTFRIDGGEISYTIAPEHRGKGYATAMLRIARERFGTCRAEIRPDNIPSIRAAESAGHVVHLLGQPPSRIDPAVSIDDEGGGRR